MINDLPRKTLNVDRSNLLPLYTLKEHDDVILKLALFKNSVSFDITGQTIRLGAKTSAGLKEQNEGFTIDKSNLDIVLKNSILSQGLVELDLQFIDANGQMTTASFFISVGAKVLNDNAVEASNEFDTFKKTVEEIQGDYQGLRTIMIDENNAANLQDQVNQVTASLEDKAPISYVDAKVGSIGNIKTFRGSCLFSELPTSNNNNSDYWYITDRLSNYCWNGNRWIDIGNNLEVGVNVIDLKNLNVEIQEDIGEYNLVDIPITKGQAYYPNSNNVAISYTTTKWNNMIIDNITAGDIFRITLCYINPDNMYGLIFTDNNMNIISTDLKGTDLEQYVKDYRVVVPKGATKLILNCFEPLNNEFKATSLNYSKIATKKFVQENSITNDELGKTYKLGINIIDSSKYENKKFIEVFPEDGTYVDIPISEYANIGDGIGLRFNIWFTDGTTITGTTRVSYLDENGGEITWFAYGNPVTASYPITSAKTVRANAISRVSNPSVTTKTIKGFTLTMEILTEFVPYKLDVEYTKIQELSSEKAIEVFNEKSESLMLKTTTNYDKIMRSINRIGYDVYNANTPPEQSIESFKLAYKKGFRILLCDLRFTKDNVPVCIHDETINSVARNLDGSAISESIKVVDKTLEELNNYDFGLKKGSKYKGTKILTLDEMCKLVKNLGVELYVEVKDTFLNLDERITETIRIIKKYALKNVSFAHDNVLKFGNFIRIAPEYRVGTMHGEMNVTRINELLTLKTPQNSLFWFSWDTSSLTTEIVNLMQVNNIEFEVGTLDSEGSLFNWFESNSLRQYCTGVSSNKIVAGKVMLENILQ